MKNSWYNIQTSDDGSRAEIFIFEEIGFWGVTAAQFIRDFKAIEAPVIDIHINSPGGEVFDGTAIYNTIRNSPKNITMIIDGLAASMAGVIAMAGDKTVMADNAFFMIHNPWGLAIGDADEMEKEAEVLNKIKEQLVTAYENKTGIAREEIAQMMDDETWFSAAEAEDRGFVDEVIKGKKKAALFDLKKYGFKKSDKYDLKKRLDKSQDVPAAPAATPAAPEIQNNEDQIMNSKELKEKHPDIYSEIFDAGKNEGITEGAENERNRINEINELGVQGHDEIVTAALADGKSTAGDVAAQVLKAEKKQRAEGIQQREDESAELEDVEAGAAPEQVDQDLDAEKIKARSKKLADNVNKKYNQE